MADSQVLVAGVRGLSLAFLAASIVTMIAICGVGAGGEVWSESLESFLRHAETPSKALLDRLRQWVEGA